MKVNPKFLIMMAALVGGSALAAPLTPKSNPDNLTAAGTSITNTATASYTDPTGVSANPLTSTSNTVSTTVLPKPGFDIRFDGDTPPDGTTQNAIGTTIKKLLNAVPGQPVDTIYTAINLGNTPLRVNLTADQTGAATGQTVKYYLAGTTSFILANEITFVDIAVDNPVTTGTDEGLTNFIQRIVVPANATKTDVFGASPAGTVAGTGTMLAANGTVTGNGYANPSVNQEEAKGAGTDLQFQAISMFTPNVDNNPNPTTTPPNPVNPDGTPNTTPPAPPTGPVQVPILNPGPTGPTGTPTVGDPTVNTPPVQPATPGYLDPSNTPIPIVPDVAGDTQKAYPKADPDNVADTVTFTNALTNTSTTQPDSLQLFPTGAVDPVTGALQNGWTFDSTTATFTQNAGNLLTEIKVQFLDPNTGNAVTVKTGAVYPTLIVPANSTAFYQTKVTYPDPDDSSVTPIVTVSIDTDSTKDADFTVESNSPTGNPSGRTTDIIYPAAAQFGDSVTPNVAGVASITPAPVEFVKPNGTNGGPTSTGATVTDGTDSTAVFPMKLVNNGQYNDSFKLKGTVTFPNATPGGALVPVTVKYYDAAGNELTKDTNGDYVSPVVGAGTEIVVRAVVDVPLNTPVGDYTVTQNASGYYSTIALPSDINDIIRIQPLGFVSVAKFAPRANTAAGSDFVTDRVNGVVIDNPQDYTATKENGALPSNNISYRIIGKNTYNTAVSVFFISDKVPANTTFESVSLVGVTAAKTIYRVTPVGGPVGAWTATAPSAGLVKDTIIDVAVDNNNDLVPDALPSKSALPAGSNELSADFVVKVK